MEPALQLSTSEKECSGAGAGFGVWELRAVLAGRRCPHAWAWKRRRGKDALPRSSILTGSSGGELDGGTVAEWERLPSEGYR